MKYEEPNFQMNTDQRSGRATGNVKTKNQEDALKKFLEECGVDLKVWMVKDYRIRKSSWDVHMKISKYKVNGESGKSQKVGDKPEKFTNHGFYISASLIRISPAIDHETFLQGLRDSIGKGPKVRKRKYPKLEGDKNLFMPNIWDLHLGRLAWYLESAKNYDVKIARSLFFASLNRLIEEATLRPIDRILYVVGQDLFNYDKAYPFPQTTNGTPQESDVRWQKMFAIGRDLMFQSIEILNTIAPVDVVVIAGNHETQTAFYLGEVLAARYANNPNITVDNTPRSRKYYYYGKNAIGVAHGRYERPEKLLGMIQADQPKFPSYPYKYFYLGDKHHEEKWLEGKYPFDPKQYHKGDRKKGGFVLGREDYMGVSLDYLPSLAQTDKYEFQEGYVGTIRAARGVIHNKERGREVEITFNS